MKGVATTNNHGVTDILRYVVQGNGAEFLGAGG